MPLPALIVTLLFSGSLQAVNCARGMAADEYDALKKEFLRSDSEAKQALAGATNAAEKQKIIDQRNESTHKFINKCLRYAETNPNSPNAPEALAFYILNGPAGPDAERASAVFLKISGPAIEVLYPGLASCHSGATAVFLRHVLEKDPEPKNRPQILFSLGQVLKRQSENLDLKADEGKKLAREAETVLAKLVNEYPNSDKKLLARANSALFELRHLQVGMKVPGIVGADVDGKSFKLSDYRGRVVLLLFWKNWNGPNRAIYSYTRSLAKRLESKPFALVGVACGMDKESVRRAMKRERTTWPSFYDGSTPSGPIATQWNIEVLPTLYIVDAQGIIRHSFGEWPGNELLDKAINDWVTIAEKLSCRASATVRGELSTTKAASPFRKRLSRLAGGEPPGPCWNMVPRE